MISVETNLLKITQFLVEQSCLMVVLSVGQILVWSIFIPFVLVVGLWVSLGYLLKVMMPFYFKVLSMQYSVECEIDDLNFQLLSLIGSYRISNIIGKLRTKQARKADQRTQIRKLNKVEFLGWLRFVIYFVACFWILLFVFVSFTIDKYPKLNLLGFSANLRLYSNVIWFRFAYFLILLPSKLCDSMLFFFDMIRVIEYLNSNLPRSRQLKAGILQQRKDQFFATTGNSPDSNVVVFRNVSLTLGYQPVLKKINLRFREGHTIGIFGFEGGGRSTILELASHILERDNPSTSSIYLFGSRIEEIDDEVIRKQVFWIEKDPVLLEGNVRENIDPYGEHSLDSIKEKLTILGFRACILKQHEDTEGRDSERIAQLRTKRINIFENRPQEDHLVGSKVPDLLLLESNVKQCSL